jgi:two-component system phosphate regulon sensor histidine kinase PhoR
MIEKDMMEKCKICLREAVDEELFIRIRRTNFKVKYSENFTEKKQKFEKNLLERKVTKYDEINHTIQEFFLYMEIMPSLKTIDSLFQTKKKNSNGSIPGYRLSLMNDTIPSFINLREKKESNEEKRLFDESTRQTTPQYDSVLVQLSDSINNKIVTVRINSNQVVKLEVTHAFGNVLQKAQYLLILSLLIVVMIAVILVFQLKNILHDNRFVQFIKEYTSALTHDLRSPLNSVNMAATVLYDETYPLKEPEKREYYRICKDQSRIMLNNIDKILTVAKAEQTNLIIKKETLCAKAYLEGLSTTFIKNNVHSKGLQIEVHCSPEDLPLIIDPNQMDNVFLNLMDNAVKYSHEEVYIIIHAFKQENQTHISVKDNGLGIPANDLEAIFLNFKQGNVLDRKRMFGYGIGLSYVKEVVKAHGGEITVTSKEGEGSIFTIILPD